MAKSNLPEWFYAVQARWVSREASRGKGTLDVHEHEQCEDIRQLMNLVSAQAEQLARLRQQLAAIQDVVTAARSAGRLSGGPSE